jgi:ectoine hydroxylase-related dioxygenase (phytanoyl-CoA dioxygenase family)
MTAKPRSAVSGWLSTDEADLDEFVSIVDEKTSLDDYPHAMSVESGVLVYDSRNLPRAGDLAQRRAVLVELADALQSGPGVVVFRHGFSDLGVVDRTSALFSQIIKEQHASGAARSDHFAKAGANDRIWNALEKHGRRDSESFVDYYANDVLALVSTAWLGPGYQVTAQVNVVNPGGEAQVPHRDYHLGILSQAAIAEFPAHVHAMSPMLTLQGAVAHVDVPVEAGPTMLLPHSQKFLPGFLAAVRPDVREHVLAHRVQLPLATGDFLFFNPAVMHGAGTNRTSDIKRMVNLFQVSSPFGKAMESIDHDGLVRAVYPSLRARALAGTDMDLLHNAVAAAADGYAFPTNADTDPPVGGVAPANQADLVRRALAKEWTPEQLGAELTEYNQRRRP